MTLNIPHGRRETGTEKQVEEKKETQEQREPAAAAEAQAQDVRGSGAREAARPEAPPAAPAAESARSAGPARPVEPPKPARPVQPVEPPKSTGSTGSVEDDGLSERMDHAVGEFVDDPRAAVREAEAVLDEAGRRFTRMLEQMRADAHGKAEPDTEELRLALTRYRDMTRKLLDLVSA
ncbi:hypothetical protein SAMN05216223_101142 [Actinacidiphila yanglinensis]|uniref:Uncharacterized protein n=1 Tax=Actinacidiphila yanglinensis TaxID=310779 RepID=A0A1H5SIR2_9ACTN|nr:hypothetical protein [Actinacidiphila yanglinensis]SEF50320.1 hypothetical protein SAMN05216223_101142 [Actinacidiphila yanglinensis]